MRSEIQTIQSAMLALLALLLSFSFSIGTQSHIGRKQVLLDEITAIGSAYYHSQLLPEPMGSEIRKLILQVALTTPSRWAGWGAASAWDAAAGG